MGSKRGRFLIYEALETRAVPAAGTGPGALAAAHAQHAGPKPENSFVAHLTTMLPNDNASAVIKVKFVDGGTQAIVSGTLRDISNPSAVILRLPAGTPTMSKPAMTITTTTPVNNTTQLTPVGPQAYATVSTVTTSMPPAQTVAVLLKPGTGTGPFLHVPFVLTINRSSLIGQLTGKPLQQLLDQMREGKVSVVVTTNNGVDPMTTVAPGNAQSGEIMGTLLPFKR
jgi:hypothetical protein